MLVFFHDAAAVVADALANNKLRPDANVAFTHVRFGLVVVICFCGQAQIIRVICAMFARVLRLCGVQLMSQMVH